MKFAVIKSSQLAVTGRWDAKFNIAYKEQEKRVNEILRSVKQLPRWANTADRKRHLRKLQAAGQTYGRFALLKTALTLPIDQESAQAIKKGSLHAPMTAEDFAHLDDLDLALYLALATDPARIETIIAEMEMQKLKLKAKHTAINRTLSRLQGVQ
jgi:hypothetical protein